MTRRSRSSAGVVGQSLPVSRVAVAASFQTGSWQVILGHRGHGSSENLEDDRRPQFTDYRLPGNNGVVNADWSPIRTKPHFGVMSG
jgi:hypothetical protein